MERIDTKDLYFNPRSREGSDDVGGTYHGIRFKFQSTLPRGERQSIRADAILIENFNPRSREGSDALIGLGFLVLTLISIHAPARGATKTDAEYADDLEFQSTLPRGERLRH